MFTWLIHENQVIQIKKCKMARQAPIECKDASLYHPALLTHSTAITTGLRIVRTSRTPCAPVAITSLKLVVLVSRHCRRWVCDASHRFERLCILVCKPRAHGHALVALPVIKRRIRRKGLLRRREVDLFEVIASIKRVVIFLVDRSLSIDCVVY